MSDAQPDDASGRRATPNDHANSQHADEQVDEAQDKAISWRQKTFCPLSENDVNSRRRTRPEDPYIIQRSRSSRTKEIPSERSAQEGTDLLRPGSRHLQRHRELGLWAHAQAPLGM